MQNALSLDELKRFDSSYKKFGKETRFLCPLPSCCNKSRESNHRSLSVNLDTGAWLCHRCSEKGLLSEFWTQPTDSGKFNKRPKSDPLKALKDKLASKQLSQPNVELTQQPNILKQYPDFVASFESSPGAEYLLSRGISEALAKLSGCGYAAKWQHWKQNTNGQLENVGIDRRVIFPVFNEVGILIAIQGRAIDKEFIEPKVMTRGKKSEGVFSTPGALATEIVCITEAPTDALSLAQVGYPAIALCGTSWPSWLLEHCAFKTIGIAFDNDKAGDTATEKLTTELKKVGAKPIRLLSIHGKDWNEVLMSQGTDLVKAEIAATLRLNDYSSFAQKENSVEEWMIGEIGQNGEVTLVIKVEGSQLERTVINVQEKLLTLDTLKQLLAEARAFVETEQHLTLPFQINPEFDFLTSPINQKHPSRWLPVFLSEIDSLDNKTRKRAIKEVVEIWQAIKHYLASKEGKI